MTHKNLLLLGALALFAFAAGCSSDECSTNADCADRGANFVCTANHACVQKTPMDAGVSCSPECSGDTPICDMGSLTCVQCTQSSDCNGDTPACDTATNTCVACTSNGDCTDPAAPACDTTTNTCVACVGNGDCTDAAAPVCDTTAHACVACLTDENCTDDAAPTCDTATNTCVGCVDSTDCTDTGAPVCDTDNQTCVGCMSNDDCGGITPVCDTGSHTCTAAAGACATDSDCSDDLSSDCDGSACVPVDVAAVSTAITTIKTTTPSSPITVAGAIVTYLKPDVSGDGAGFFVQAAPTGPALFVGVDTSSLDPAPAVGQRVSFDVTTTTLNNDLVVATMDTATWTVISSGHDASKLRQDVSTVDLPTSIAADESELISLTFTVAGTPSPANTGYMQAQITSAGVTTASNNFKLYAPATVFESVNIAKDCTGQITNGTLWRYQTSAEPAVWSDADLTLTSCPFNLVGAAALDATHVVLTFDRDITGTPVVGDFTVVDTSDANSALAVSAVSVSGPEVTLTTAAQVGGDTYQVTVGSAVKDDLGASLDPGSDTATFSGFITPAQVVINELNANIGNSTDSCDLIELRVMSGGTMENYRLQERDSGSLVTFPAGYVVATNDLIVVHMDSTSTVCNPNGATSETTAKDELPAATYAGNYDSAWDVWSTDGGLTNTDNVFTLYDALGDIMDAVFVSDDVTGTSAAATERQAATVAEAGQWQINGGGVPAGGFVDDDFSANAAQDLNDTGTDATGESIQRSGDTDNNEASDWTQSAQSWGALNAGQTAQ